MYQVIDNKSKTTLNKLVIRGPMENPDIEYFLEVHASETFSFIGLVEEKDQQFVSEDNNYLIGHMPIIE